MRIAQCKLISKCDLQNSLIYTEHLNCADSVSLVHTSENMTSLESDKNLWQNYFKPEVIFTRTLRSHRLISLSERNNSEFVKFAESRMIFLKLQPLLSLYEQGLKTHMNKTEIDRFG